MSFFERYGRARGWEAIDKGHAWDIPLFFNVEQRQNFRLYSTLSQNRAQIMRPRESMYTPTIVSILSTYHIIISGTSHDLSTYLHKYM